jgi:hypothetical protein
MDLGLVEVEIELLDEAGRRRRTWGISHGWTLPRRRGAGISSALRRLMTSKFVI